MGKLNVPNAVVEPHRIYKKLHPRYSEADLRRVYDKLGVETEKVADAEGQEYLVSVTEVPVIMGGDLKHTHINELVAAGTFIDWFTRMEFPSGKVYGKEVAKRLGPLAALVVHTKPPRGLRKQYDGAIAEALKNLGLIE